MGALGNGAGRVLCRAGSAVAARPLFYAGSASFLALSFTIGTNALFAQASRHPHPMLATRLVDPATAGTRVADAAPATQTRSAEPWQPTNDPRVMVVPLVRDVQELLARTGHYQASIDGRPGQAPDRAIRTFQAERGLQVDGMATTLLLTQIRQVLAEPPAPGERPEGTEYASLDDLLSNLSTGAISANDATAVSEQELVRRIQAGLSAASVASLKADGIMGERTRAAIRSFQELEGLDVDGEPSLQLLARLEEIQGRP